MRKNEREFIRLSASAVASFLATFSNCPQKYQSLLDKNSYMRIINTASGPANHRVVASIKARITITKTTILNALDETAEGIHIFFQGRETAAENYLVICNKKQILQIRIENGKFNFREQTGKGGVT